MNGSDVFLALKNLRSSSKGIFFTFQPPAGLGFLFLLSGYFGGGSFCSLVSGISTLSGSTD